MEFITKTVQFIRENGLNILSWVAGIIAVFSFLADAKNKKEDGFKISRRSAILLVLAATCIAVVIESSNQVAPASGTDDLTQTGNPSPTVPDRSNDPLFVSDYYSQSYEELPDGVVSGWGDNGNGRDSYTTDQIKAGVLGDQIVFNSISDGKIGHEKNFVGACVNDGTNAGEDNRWNGNLIEVEAGKTYIIRLYCHNNSPLGLDAVAEDVEVCFSIPPKIGRTVVVNGLLQSSNASPQKYWDGVVFTSERLFYLEYVPGTARLENAGVASDGGIALDDQIAEGRWCKLGYDRLDGQIPGGTSFDAFVTIQVRPVFESDLNAIPVPMPDGPDGDQPDSGVPDNDTIQDSKSDPGNSSGSGAGGTNSGQSGETGGSSDSSTKDSSVPKLPDVTVTQVALSYTVLNLMVDETDSLLATVLYSDGTSDHTASWISSNPAVASVDSTGHIIALSAGTTQITAQASKNNVSESASCLVTVAPPPAVPTGYEIRLSTDHAVMGEVFRLYITPYEDDVTQIMVHTTSPSGLQDSFPLSADGKYLIDTEAGIWTIYASVSNEVGTYTASKESDYVHINIASFGETVGVILQGLA